MERRSRWKSRCNLCKGDAGPNRNRWRIGVVAIAVLLSIVLVDVASGRSHLSVLNDAIRIGTVAPDLCVADYQWVGSDRYLATDNAVPDRLDLNDARSGNRVISTIASASQVAGLPLDTGRTSALVRPDGHSALWTASGDVESIDLSSTGRATGMAVRQLMRAPHRFGGSNSLTTVFNRAAGGGWTIASVAWMPDSRSWLDIKKQQGIPPVLERRDLSGRCLESSAFGHADDNPSLLGILPDGTGILYFGAGSLMAVASGRGFPVLCRWNIAVPSGMDIADPMLSPDGSRILWVCQTFAHWRTLRDVASHIIPFVDQDRTLRLTISDLDGRRMRQIAETTWVLDGGQSGYSNFRWMPDGRHISFTHAGALWTAPVFPVATPSAASRSWCRAS